MVAPRANLSLGARRSYVDVFIPLVTQDTGFQVKPRYWDYSAKYVRDMIGCSTLLTSTNRAVETAVTGSFVPRF